MVGHAPKNKMVKRSVFGVPEGLKLIGLRAATHQDSIKALGFIFW